VSTESIARTSRPGGDTYPCAVCGAPLADDQRYCLECGERRAPVSSSVLGATPPAGLQAAGSGGGAPPESAAGGAQGPGRNNTLTVIAGVGVLLLAMGVGVLIGRSAGSKQSAAPPQVISVAGTTSAPTSTPAAAEASLTDSWPSGTSGYTVQLQTLPQSGTKVSEVEAAKAVATAKRAKGVGALKSEDFSSLKAGSYVIYAGIYHKRAEAERALRGLKKSFPSAIVIAVNNGSGASSSAEPSETPSNGSGVGQSYLHPAPPSVVENAHKTKGQGFEQKSKNLPNVISTG
jgi:hypothetical protein